MEEHELYDICKKNYKLLKNIKIELSSSYTYQITNPNHARNVIESLDRTEYLDSFKNFKSLFDEIGYREISDTSLVKDFRESQSKLLFIMDSIIKSYEEKYSPDETEIGLDIKLPVNANFSDFRKNIDDLDFVLTKCPFFQDKEEHLQFKSINKGSILFTFGIIGIGTLGASLILNNIAAFIDQCFILKSHRLTIEKQKQDVEMSKYEQQQKEAIIKHLDLLYKLEVDASIKSLEDLLNHKLEDGDEKGRVEQSIEKINKLIDQGIQIYTTLGTPEETKLLFEPLKMKYLPIEDSLKSIEKND